MKEIIKIFNDKFYIKELDRDKYFNNVDVSVRNMTIFVLTGFFFFLVLLPLIAGFIKWEMITGLGFLIRSTIVYIILMSIMFIRVK